MKKRIIFILVLVFATVLFSSCEAYPSTYGGTSNDIRAQSGVADKLSSAQPTPTDIDYSLERFNLIRRAYWVNGQREKANNVICPIERPLGYIVLFSGSATVGSFVVDGKVSSLNSFLSPSNVDSVERYGDGSMTTITTETADVDGSYGENDSGIFFFTPDGKYIEWTGTYLYSDIPFEVSGAVVTCQEADQ